MRNGKHKFKKGDKVRAIISTVNSGSGLVIGDEYTIASCRTANWNNAPTYNIIGKGSVWVSELELEPMISTIENLQETQKELKEELLVVEEKIAFMKANNLKEMSPNEEKTLRVAAILRDDSGLSISFDTSMKIAKIFNG